MDRGAWRAIVHRVAKSHLTHTHADIQIRTAFNFSRSLFSN